MPTNRRLVNRSRMNETASPAPPRRQQQQRASETPVRQPARQIELPSYESPACPLSAEAQQKLNILRTSHNYSKYKTHIKSAISIVTTSAADSNERLSIRREEVQKTNDRRQRNGKADEDKDEDDINAERVLKHLEKNVPEFTIKAEVAVRELIDYGDELSMQDAMMRDVSESIASAPAPEPPNSRRRRAPVQSDDENEEEEEIEPPGEEPDQVSAIKILRQMKGNYSTEYKAKTLTSRYADHNDYKGFKGAVHVAQTLNSGEDPPHSSTWFPEETAASNSRRRNNNTTDNTNNGDEDSSDDDEVVITNISERLTCPLTIAWFKEPLSNSKCKHSFEKKAILNHLNLEGRMYNDPNKPEEASKKVVKCPETGCDAMLSLDDFYDDAILLRKVKYAQKKERVQAYDDDDDDGPRGTQRNRPEDISEGDDDAIDVDEEERRARVAKIKRERGRSRGLSMAPSQSQAAAPLDSDEEMTMN